MKRNRTKKWGFALAVLGLCTFAASPQAQGNTGVSGGITNTYVYYNIMVYKVESNQNAYVVTYAKHDKGGIGQMVIPKKWAKEDPRRLLIRSMPKKVNPYMSIYYTADGIEHIQLTLPLSRQHRVWGIGPKQDVLGDVGLVDTLAPYEL
jgi:hypothetical protein